MSFWIGGEASGPQGGSVQTGKSPCQEQSRDTPGLVNNRSNILLQLHRTLSFSLILLLMKCGIPRAGIGLCRNRREVLWRDMDYVAAASRPTRP